jgi:hypothetical protein
VTTNVLQLYFITLHANNKHNRISYFHCNKSHALAAEFNAIWEKPVWPNFKTHEEQSTFLHTSWQRCGKIRNLHLKINSHVLIRTLGTGVLYSVTVSCTGFYLRVLIILVSLRMRKLCHYVGFEVLTEMIMKSYIFWDIRMCSTLKVNRRFGGTCLLLHGRRKSLAGNQRKAGGICLFLDP